MHFHLVHQNIAKRRNGAVARGLTHGVIQDVPLPHAFFYLRQLQSHARTDLPAAQHKMAGFRNRQEYFKPSLGSLTSVRRTALCCDAMFPLPE